MTSDRWSFVEAFCLADLTPSSRGRRAGPFRIPLAKSWHALQPLGLPLNNNIKGLTSLAATGMDLYIHLCHRIIYISACHCVSQALARLRCTRCEDHSCPAFWSVVSITTRSSRWYSNISAFIFINTPRPLPPPSRAFSFSSFPPFYNRTQAIAGAPFGISSFH